MFKTASLGETLTVDLKPLLVGLHGQPSGLQSADRGEFNSSLCHACKYQGRTGRPYQAEYPWTHFCVEDEVEQEEGAWLGTADSASKLMPRLLSP